MKFIVRLLSFSLLIAVSLFSACSDPTETPAPKPSIVSFSPSHGLVGETIIITGTNFNATAAENILRFNGIAAIVTTASSTQLTTTVPSGATTGKLTLSIAGNTVQSETDFTVDLPVALPSITSFSPSHALVGETIIITGTNFSPVATENIVEFGGIAATVTNATTTQLTTTVPAGATTAKLSVTVSGNTVQSAVDFTVDPPAPTVCLLTKYTVVSSEYSDDFYNTTYSSAFEYNDNDELISSGNDENLTTYTYVDGLVTEAKTVYEDMTTIEKWTYNDDKLVSHVAGTITYLGVESVYTKDFVYSNAKKLISITRTSIEVPSYLMTFTYTGDNVTAYVALDTDSNEEIESFTYTDFDAKKNPFLFLAKATGNQAFFISEVTSPLFLSANNTKTVNSSNGEGSYTIAYEYDANDNVIKMTTMHPEGGKDVITFEYSCH